MSQRVELLAPAGNPEGFYGAIHAGADAVYLAGSRFGARAYADNFTTEELVACIRYAHIWGRRVYLTVNTLVRDSELNELAPYLTPFYEAGLDGVIVQDIGVFCYIREHFPDMELHVSTQMTLTGVYGARLLQKMGAVRIVPARELSLSELVDIKEQTGLSIETFIHGAMCYCYSGQCLFSSILGGRSGNRGRCAQPCRLPYRVENAGRTSGECYPLSLKDMCTIEHIPELIGAGIDSFKIEGRMKKPEYAAGVTAIYRKYIDKYYAGEDCGVSRKDLDILGKLYIRSERQDGYYYRHNGKDMVTLNNPSYSGTDEVLLADIRERYLNQRPRIKLDITADFRVGQEAVLTFAHRENPEWRVEVRGDMVSEAMKQPISEENIRKQLSKLGETVFAAEEVQIVLDNNAFYPLKAINDLRREATVLLENLIIQKQGLCVKREVIADTDVSSQVQTTPAAELKNSRVTKTSSVNIVLRTIGQLKALIACLGEGRTDITIPGRVYIDGDCIYEAANLSDNSFWELCDRLHDMGSSLNIALPHVLRKRDDGFLALLWETFCQRRELFEGFLVRSMDGMGFLEEKGYGKQASDAIYADAGFYIWNRESKECFGKENDKNTNLSVRLDGYCLPYELKAAQQRHLLKTSQCSAGIRAEKIIYGRIPLMLTANCLTNTVSGCNPKDSDKISYLTDRYKKRFPVLRNCTHCMNTVYNSLPLSLHGEFEKWRGEVDFRLDFTIEDERETGQILQYFLSGAKGAIPFGEYTTGHEKRGAE